MTLNPNEPNVLFNLAYYPDKNLSLNTKVVTDFSNIPTISDLMFDTMLMNNGIGLAANQCKINLRMFVMRTAEIRKTFINPIVLSGENKKTFNERCLSFPGIVITKERFNNIVLAYSDTDGSPQEIELKGIEAICAQHEIEHLDGKTFIDHLGRLKQKLIATKVKNARRKSSKF